MEAAQGFERSGPLFRLPEEAFETWLLVLAV
jgi:hypothetical protein